MAREAYQASIKMEQRLCGHVLSANNKLNGDIRRAGVPWAVPIGLRERVEGDPLEVAPPSGGMSAPLKLEIEVDKRYAYWIRTRLRKL